MKDKCEICKGEKGGVPGNENIEVIAGRNTIVCDYCSAELLQSSPNLDDYL